jgi:hypothetical protein
MPSWRALCGSVYRAQILTGLICCGARLRLLNYAQTRTNSIFRRIGQTLIGFGHCFRVLSCCTESLAVAGRVPEP